MNEKPNVQIYIDGAAIPTNPGHGGAGVVLLFADAQGVTHQREIGVYLGPKVTNNAAEIRAALEALWALKRPCAVTVFSDSQYVVNTMRLGWKRNANHDLWAELDALCEVHDVSWRWVKGHAGDEYNERAHELAEGAASARRDGAA